MSNAALIIIDVQSAFFIKDLGVYAYKGEEYLAKIKELITRARKAGVPVIYVQHDGAEGTPFEPGKPGWPIHPAIAPRGGELVIHKPTPDAFYRTTLQTELEARGIRRLIIAGIQSDWCVDTTVRRAYSLEYDVTVAEDAHTTYDTEILKAPQIIAHHNTIFGGRFAKLAKAEDIDFTKLALL
ncbi:MAG: cysteine hydrolase family protein [Candidatus Bathyarchaeota archaeon]|nr:cysteine hydrolase family protein [Candidatus Bathyarchaeota archaeon]